MAAKIVKTELPKLCDDYISCCKKESLKPHEVATLPVLCSQSFHLKTCESNHTLIIKETV